MEQSLRDKLIEIGKLGKIANKAEKNFSTKEKNAILLSIKESLDSNRSKVIEANAIDMSNGEESGLSSGLLDRLMLDDSRIDSMVKSIDDMIALADPIGNMTDVRTLENGLLIGKKSVPIGVLAMIYEARPNVTLDASILAIKSSNAIILRGGKEAFHSCVALSQAIREGIESAGYDPNIVQYIDDTSRESSIELMKLRGYVDLLIPRGSARLIQSVMDNATVPTLETGVGNCHLYVDADADIDKAVKIFENAKTQRIGVCNALESLLIHESVAPAFYEGLNKVIADYSIKVHASSDLLDKIPGSVEATDEDYATEYLDYEFSAKTVKNVDEAIEHIYQYSTGHSDAIVTEDLATAKKFTDQVDSSCVYVNASTRFTDGSEFGYGAEIGISTQRLHARGPVGLKELTSYKYVIVGEGQVR